MFTILSMNNLAHLYKATLVSGSLLYIIELFLILGLDILLY